MLVDTQPATHQHLPASPEVRDQWVNAQLIGVLMDNMVPSLLAATLALPVLIFMMAGEVDFVSLLIWTGLLVTMLVYRYRLIGIYQLRYDSSEGPQRMAFVERYQWTWGVMGFLWGGGVLLSYLKASPATQFVCGIVVLGQGLLTLTAFSAYLPVFRRYVHALVLSVFLGLALNTLRATDPTPVVEQSLALMALLMVFWWLLLVAGNRLHQIYRASFELQFSNQELIDSLTQQTRASIRAVATKNRFLASAAHDLRQPVHALSLYADWLATEPEMARDISPRILQSTRAINELFDSLFDLTRIDAGNYKVRLQNVDVLQLFAELATQFEPVAAGKSLKFRTYAKPTTLWADPVVLRRILGNLLSNAFRHTRRGGVLLGLRRREDVLVFEVWDTGVGIAREHQQAIFQEFFRVSQHQGTEDSLGLGLTIVSKLTTLMGYQLALSSEAERGSVFRVLLPAYTQKSEKSALETATTPDVVVPRSAAQASG
ncbi:HAMP domain-containing histidine kinase [Hydrogenophaga aromaticivorans]|uniref:sensor histidine kinase n=1 Tax=Hydrogenophaga aromaticivorans TaxID=2610898 RepID=UPI001B35CA3E|nr:HAMP domain-containing sensor histidine kinase [Hydrogenophaga aromaticivorans]MBQ0919824.1 HAMP domain-containing histidine kinase [Hydrogenophaga aromaticivorans]